MRIIKVILMAILMIIGVGGLTLGYAFLVEPGITVTHEYDLKAKNANVNLSIRIVQLSDIQVNEYYTVDKLNELVEKVNRLEPDIVVFTGDLFDNYAKFGPVEEITRALKNLNGSYGKYAIWGNRDYGGGASRVYQDIMDESGFTLLSNEGTTVSLPEGQQIFIGGIDDYLLGTPDVLQVLSQMDDSSSYKIILVHEPDAADELADSSADLILAGHSHGGQVRIPFSKGIRNVMAEKYTEGFYSINEDSGLQLYVNTGIGTSHLPIRFMVPPEISVFDLAL